MSGELLARLQDIIAADRQRMHVLQLAQELDLPDCWVAAGFVRSAVWDYLHQRSPSPLPDDIDVIWHDPGNATQEHDAMLESRLRACDATLGWSVKNQARMHERNADLPYLNASDAMRHWPETATAVGVRLGRQGSIEVAAPFGLHDLFDLIVRPTERFLAGKQALYADRIHCKNWQAAWPMLRIALPD
ncbi:hypothetical protein GCM43_00625 [Janthinobacterium aquaticum]|nr:hypothetical protein GCM43_00625 [Janthinobacterium sp. FT58W]